MSQGTTGGSSASTAALRKALRNHLSPDDLSIWFRGMTCSSVTPEHLEVELPNELYVDWVEQHYRAELEAAVREAFGPVKVVLKYAELSSAGAAKARKDAAKQAPRTGVFMKIYYSWLDEIQPRIGATAWVVFERLIRFIWRAETHVGALQSHVEQGDLVAYVSVGKIAKTTGLDRRTVQRQLRKLEELGLIQTIKHSAPGQIRLYRLGREVDGQEIWLADQIAEKYRTSH